MLVRLHTQEIFSSFSFVTPDKQVHGSSARSLSRGRLFLSVFSFFCLSSTGVPSSTRLCFYQGRSEMLGVLWQLFKQPHSLSKGRCLHWSESCLFSSGRCFPPQARVGMKIVFLTETWLRKLVGLSGKNTPWLTRSLVCVFVCLQLTVEAKLSESCDNWSQMLPLCLAATLPVCRCNWKISPLRKTNKIKN